MITAAFPFRPTNR